MPSNGSNRPHAYSHTAHRHRSNQMPPRSGRPAGIKPWTKDEDEALLKAVAVHGCKAWSAISCALPGRTGKACRERWFNHLNPALRPDEWTPAEDATIFGAPCYPPPASRRSGQRWQ